MALKDLAELHNTSKIIFDLVETIRLAKDPNTLDWANSVLDHACRQLEHFVSPEVSERAAKQASAKGLPDIRDFTWHEQVTRMSDVGRKIFHWEHVLPVAEMKRRLLHESTKTQDDVERIISKVDIAWILKSEDQSLTAGGFRHMRRDNPWDAYEETGIKMLPSRSTKHILLG